MPAVVNTELGSGLPDTRGVKKLEPEEVADAIVEAIETNRFDVWVPKLDAPESPSCMNLLPRRGREAIAPLPQGRQGPRRARRAKRAAYEERAAHSTAEEQAADAGARARTS